MSYFTFESLLDSCQNEWNEYTQHSFIKQMAQGTLDKSCFKHYLIQDYLFLIHFSRAWGLAVYKSRNLKEIRDALNNLKAIVDTELDLHISYCKEWGIDGNALYTQTEAKANIAYTRYVLDVGQQGQLVDLHIALAPCIIGYGMIANWIKQSPLYKEEGNPYQSWIEMYASDEYQLVMKNEINWLTEQLQKIEASRFEQLATIFKNATRLESDFWQMGLDKSY